jgi:hypothetical protein
MTSPSHFDRFLSEAIAVDREAGAGLGPDALYGLYTSWCLMTDAHTATARALFKALKDRHGISSSNNALAMTGPAARNYILASAPNVIWGDTGTTFPGNVRSNAKAGHDRHRRRTPDEGARAEHRRDATGERTLGNARLLPNDGSWRRY